MWSKATIYMLIAAAFAIAGWWVMALVFIAAAVVIGLVTLWAKLPKPPQNW